MSFWNKFEKPADAPQAPQPSAAPPAPPALPSEPAGARAAPPPPPAPAAPAPQAPAPPSARAEGGLRLGRGVRLEGKLTFSGTVRIDATFKGSITTDGVLVVGEDAKVDADISCGTVIVEGEVNGNVTAREAVELRRAATVRGEIESPSLAVERGAVFQGASRRPGIRSSATGGGKAAAAPTTT
jgi:cytoskeletal protein CcmA (bactofilin family)